MSVVYSCNIIKIKSQPSTLKPQLKTFSYSIRPQAFNDSGYADVHWTLESIITDLQSEDKTFYQIFQLDVLLGDFITDLEDWESVFEVDTAVDDIRDSIDGIVDEIVDYATWNEEDTEIITAVSNITGWSNLL